MNNNYYYRLSSRFNTSKNRFESFIQKLLVKANELEIEAKLSAQTVYDEDSDHYKRAYHQFKLGIEGQFKGLITKANDVFKQNIFPLRDSNKFSDHREWFSELREVSMNFESNIRKKINNVFCDVQEISNEIYLQQILQEYEAIKNAFNCNQCSASLNVDQLYFVSTYITCPFCKTQNTFIPGSRMAQLEGLSRDLASERLKYIELQNKTISNSEVKKCEKFVSYIYYRARIWVEKSNIVPIYKENYMKVCLREIYDMLSDFKSKEIELDIETYEFIISNLGFKKEMKPEILIAYQNNNSNKVTSKINDWEMLYQLSSILMTYLYQGEKYQELHNLHFKRIETEWNVISKLNKALIANEMQNEQIIKIIQTEL